MPGKIKKIVHSYGSDNIKSVNLNLERLKSHENKNRNTGNNIDNVAFDDVFSRFN